MYKIPAIKPSSGGIQDGIKGIEYQNKLIQLFSLKAFNESSNFECWTEDERAGKFDDLIFRDIKEEKITYTFLQAKQKATPKILELANFLADKNFELHKYFESFIELENSFGIDYECVDLKDLILCTNDSLPTRTEDGLLVLSNYKTESELIFEAVNEHEAFNKIGTKYKFSKSHHNENFECLKNMFLAAELFKLLFKNSSKNYLLKHSKEFVCTKIFEMMDDEDSIEFRSEFLTSPGPQQFVKFFKEIYRLLYVESDKNRRQSKPTNLFAFLKNMNLAGNLKSTVESFEEDDCYVQQKIESFMDKFLIVAELKEQQIDSLINFEILTEIYDFGELEMALLKFQDSVKEWLMAKETEKSWKPIDYEMVQEILFPYKEKLFKTDDPEFLTNCELKEFLESSSFLIYEVPENEKHWALLKIRNYVPKFFYLNTNCNENVLESAVTVVKNANRKIFIVVECSEDCQYKVQTILSKLNFTANFKLILICDKNFRIEGCKKVVEGETLCSNLTRNSLENHLNKKLKFQGFELKLEELISADRLKEVPLKQLESFNNMGYILSRPEIYLPRSICQKVFLSKKIVEDFQKKKFEDLICFREEEFAGIAEDIPKHLIEAKIDEENSLEIDHFLWKKSHKSLQVLRDYISQDKFVIKSEKDFLSHAETVCLVVGQAGMGKSSFFQNLACALKEKFPHYWVQKIDLQAYYEDLEEIEETFKENQFEEIQNFFYSRFMKLNSQLELTIFKNLMESGRVILLLDGYDEICEIYKNTVITIISALLQISMENKMFLSTRPEWKEFLENRFLQFSLSFQAFTEENQVEFLQQFWNKNDSWKPLIRSLLGNLSKSITKKEKSFTGIPLITKLLGEFFKEKILNKNYERSMELQDELLTHQFSLSELLQFFTSKTFEIYCTKQLGIQKGNPNFKSILKRLKKEHQKLAFLVLFPKFMKKLFPNFAGFDEDLSNKFIKTGLVFYLNGKLLFHHQTSAEFLVATFFQEYFEDSNVLEFIFTVVLLDNGCQFVRLLMNDFFESLITDDNRGAIKDFLIRNIQILSVAAKESNLETFNILFDILTENLDAINLKKVKTLLMAKDSNDITIFYNLFAYCDISNDFLDKLKRIFGLNFISGILKATSGKNGLKLLFGAAHHGKNYISLLTWLSSNFSQNSETMNRFVLMKNQISSDILHKAVENFEEESFFGLLNEMKCLETYKKEEFLSQLLFSKNFNGQNFLLNLVDHMGKARSDDEESLQVVLKVLEWIKEYDLQTFEKTLLHDDKFGRNLVFYFARNYKKKLLELIKVWRGFLNSLEFLLHKDVEGYTFLIQIVWQDPKNEAPTIITEIFNSLKEHDLNTLKNLIQSKNIYGKSLIDQFCHMAKFFNFQHLPGLLKTIVSWLENNLPNFNRNEFLLQKDNRGYTFLNSGWKIGSQMELAYFEIEFWLRQIDYGLYEDLLGRRVLGKK